ncbi:hypothetical protein ACFE04_026597 [Oxalis oulophora]
MGKEETPQVIRRQTRSAAATPSKSTTVSETAKKINPSINDLMYGGGEPISYEDLLSSFPGRRVQINQLLRLLGPLDSSMLPVFVNGGSSTGKTSIVLQMFRHLDRPFAYVSCRTCYSPRILFESILNQLLLHRKSGSNEYASAKRCDKPSDFVNLLREALVGVVDSLKKSSDKPSSSNSKTQPKGRMIYLVFDNLELIRDWDKSSSILPLVFNLYDILKMPEVGLIFISNTSPDTYYLNMGFTEAIPVCFPDYTEEDLRQIFMRNQPNKKLYSCFLDYVLKPFCRVTRHMDELSTVFSSLYKKYCEPLTDLGVTPNEEMKRKLFSHLKPHIASSLNDMFKISSLPSNKNEAALEKCKSSTKKSGGGDFDAVDFHMSTSAKYLLISAFLASRNPATLDASLFDSTGGAADGRKRKRKASEKSIENKETAEQELLMKGPGTFPLERLLAIYQCVTSVAEGFPDEEEGNDGISVEGGSGLMSDVLLQLSSLCNANFIIKGSSCPLEGSTRYRSTVSEGLALKVARSLKFPLSKYMYRR